MDINQINKFAISKMKVTLYFSNDVLFFEIWLFFPILFYIITHQKLRLSRGVRDSAEKGAARLHCSASAVSSTVCHCWEKRQERDKDAHDQCVKFFDKILNEFNQIFQAIQDPTDKKDYQKKFPFFLLCERRRT